MWSLSYINIVVLHRIQNNKCTWCTISFYRGLSLMYHLIESSEQHSKGCVIVIPVQK